LDVKKLFTEEQIIGFLREAEAGMPLKTCAGGTDSASRRISCGVASSAAWPCPTPSA
jgi:hypothetical protein